MIHIAGPMVDLVAEERLNGLAFVIPGLRQAKLHCWRVD